MNKNARKVILFAILFLLCFLTGCQKQKEEEESAVIYITKTPTIEEPIETTPYAEETIQPKETPRETSNPHKGEAKSKLTGLWIDKEAANKRPYAIMFNNIKLANPQSGIGQASIVYEALTEGGITRLMGIFENFDSERIGSVRSARHYFVSFADEYDAILVHYGQSSYGKKKIKALGIDHLNGLEQIGSTVYYRDHSIKAPHNAFTSKDAIQKGTKKLGFRTKYKEDFAGHFTFQNETSQLPQGKPANRITLKFSSYTAPYFLYNKQKKWYERYQFGAPHIDKNTKETLAFQNIIVQFVKEWTLDKKGYQSMDIENSSGKGYYITNGKAVEITWIKKEAEKKMQYQNTAGEELVLNPGKTYIAVFPDNSQSKVVIE